MKAPTNGALKAVTIAAMLWAIESIALAQGPDGARPHTQRGMASTVDWQDGPPPAFHGGPGMGGPGGPEGRGPGMGGPGGPGGRRMGIVEIPAKALAIMLGLSSEQTEKIAAIQKEGRPQRPPMGRMNGGDHGGPAMGGREDGLADARGRAAMGPDRRKKTKDAIMAVLTESQKGLVPQVTDEAAALRAARIPLPALQDLGLSSDQLKKIAAIGADGRKKANALLTSDGEDSDGSPQDGLRDAEEDMGDDVRALLSADQKAKVRVARRQFRPGSQDGPPPPFGQERGGRQGHGRPGGPGGPGFDSAEEGFDGPPPPMDGGQGGPPRQARGPGGRQGGGGRGFDGPRPGGPGFDGPEIGGPGMPGDGPGGPPPPDADVY